MHHTEFDKAFHSGFDETKAQEFKLAWNWSLKHYLINSLKQAKKKWVRARLKIYIVPLGPLCDRRTHV